MTKYLIAHDLGTSGNKATLYTTEGQLIKSTVYPYSTDYFNGNWAEQNPDDWWKAVCCSTKQLLSGVDKTKVKAISFSGQMMGCVCVDKNGVPLRNAIIWADQRSTKETQTIMEKMEQEKFYRITGHKMSPSYSIEKLMWIKNNEPEVYKKTYRMLLAKDYIIYKLTGEFVTDYSDASGTNIFDLNTFRWSDEIITVTKIDGEKLPKLRKSIDVVGEITSKVSEECGLAVGTKVVCGGGDGLCASVGAASIKEGVTYNYLGSSSWISLTTKEPIYDDQMRTFNWAHIVPGYVAPCGTMQAAGGSFNWLKNEICREEIQQANKMSVSPYELINKQIMQSKPTANGLLYLPYLLGERSPRWNPNAKGAFVGLKMEHERKDVLRAVIEGIIMNLNIILDIFKKTNPIEEINVIGGLAQGEIQRQIMADIYGINICKLNYLEEATSMGAAVTAGVGVGELKGFEAIHDFIKIDSVNYPIEENRKKYEKMKPIFDECYYSLLRTYEQLAKI